MSDRAPDRPSDSPCPPVPQELPWPAEDRPLLAFLPMIYVAWADGELGRDEIAAIRERVEEVPLDERSRRRLAAWLDPDEPPPPRELQAMLRLVRRAGEELEEGDRAGLADLGRRLARSSAEEEDGDGELPEEVSRALAEVEEALGVVAEETARELLERGPESGGEEVEIGPEEGEPRLDPAALTALLDGRYGTVRGRLRRLLASPEFDLWPGGGPVGALPVEEYREKVLAWCRRLSEEGFGGVAFSPEHVPADGEGDLAKFIALFETLALHDPSLVVKFGVQFGLFGGSILQLGTEKHHRKYLADVASLELPGCFAMSEVGHGSNVREVETVATYDAETGEFVIHTPEPSARKQWIGNAAAHGRMATVFAQLVLPGDGGEREEHGVHAFLVPIRGEDGEALPGVTLEDSGLKGGLNGVDNGLIGFDRIRVPRENLLDRFATVHEDGGYESPIPGSAKRFFTMLGTLVGGRISVGAASVTAAKVGLATAVRYAAHRRQFGPAGGEEMRILDYLSHQRRLLPRVATAYALSFALADVRDRFVEAKAREEDTREIETLAAGLKVRASRFTVDTLQECREACGGQGFLAVNRIPFLRADLDVFTTFEGDNTVLLQLVAKGVLTGFRQELQGFQPWTLVRHLAHRAAMEITEANPLVARQTDEEHLRDASWQVAALRYREQRLTWSAAGRLRARIQEGMDSFRAFNEVQDHLLALARAFVERALLERFVEGVEGCEDEGLRRVLDSLRTLHALWQMEADRGWFLKNGVLAASKASAVRDLVNDLCRELRPRAVALVEGFGIPEELLPPIASEDAL